MEENNLDTKHQQTINPIADRLYAELNDSTEQLLKKAIVEFGFKLPLTFRIYNQIRYYEEYGKLKMGTSVASKETLAKQFGVTVKQVDQAFDNLSNKYKLGRWVDHQEPVHRNVKRTWMSNVRLKKGTKYYSVIPEVLQRNTSLQGSDPSRKVRESKSIPKGIHADALPKTPPKPRKFHGEVTALVEKLPPSWHVTQKDRWAANRLLKKHGLKEVCRVLKRSQELEGEFAPRVDSVEELERKWDKVCRVEDYHEPIY